MLEGTCQEICNVRALCLQSSVVGIFCTQRNLKAGHLDAASDRGRYGKARTQILHVINAALNKVNLKYSLPPYPSQPMDRRMMQLLANMPTEALPDVQPLSY